MVVSLPISGFTSGFTSDRPAPGGAHLGLHQGRRVPQVGTSRCCPRCSSPPPVRGLPHWQSLVTGVTAQCSHWQSQVTLLLIKVLQYTTNTVASSGYAFSGDHTDLEAVGGDAPHVCMLDSWESELLVPTAKGSHWQSLVTGVTSDGSHWQSLSLVTGVTIDAAHSSDPLVTVCTLGGGPTTRTSERLS
eukprot:576001-Prymnesium_polylepis.1